MKRKSFTFNLPEPLDRGPYGKILAEQYNNSYDNSFAVFKESQMKQNGLKDVDSKSLVIFYEEENLSNDANTTILEQLAQTKKKIFTQLKILCENIQIIKETN